MRRALLVFNPEATSVSVAVREVIAHALSSQLKLELAETKRQEHAQHLARGAAHEGYDLLIALTGDGTLNEIVNGLDGAPIPVVPLPGGGTNVFARAMGLPNDPIEATSAVLDQLSAGVPPRRITLGRVNGRLFLSNAGIGFDAAIVRAVERRFRMKRRIGDPFFVFQGVRLFLFAYPRRDPPLHIEAEDRTIGPLHQVVVCKSNPYTYLGTKPFQVCPLASQERGLDVTGLASFRTITVLRAIARAFGSGGHVKMRSVHSLHDLDRFTVTSDRPILYQLDGELVGEDMRFAFEVVPNALSVVA